MNVRSAPLSSSIGSARAGDVGALADQRVVGVGTDCEGLKTTQPCEGFLLAWAMRRVAGDGFVDGADVLGRGAATTADQVQPALTRELAERPCHCLRRQVVAAELVG